jgi:hypothetical protein
MTSSTEQRQHQAANLVRLVRKDLQGHRALREKLDLPGHLDLLGQAE